MIGKQENDKERKIGNNEPQPRVIGDNGGLDKIDSLGIKADVLAKRGVRQGSNGSQVDEL